MLVGGCQCKEIPIHPKDKARFVEIESVFKKNIPMD